MSIYKVLITGLVNDYVLDKGNNNNIITTIIKNNILIHDEISSKDMVVSPMGKQSLPAQPGPKTLKTATS